MQQELDDIIATENLRDEPARKFIKSCFVNGEVETSGTEIAQILPPMNPFAVGGDREKKKNSVIEKIKAFFEKFFDLISFKN